MRIPSRELSFVKKMGVARVATVDQQGVPHVVPVCPVVEGSRIYFASETTAKKIQNIKADPQIAIVFDQYHDSWRGLKGVMIQGRARLIDQKTFRRVRRSSTKNIQSTNPKPRLNSGSQL